MTRDRYNEVGAYVSIALALASLVLALNPCAWLSEPTHKTLGKFIVAFWAVVPPVFFWWDWVYFCAGLGAPERDIAKHTHGLARNIWLGLVAILTFAFFKNFGLS
jgi:hypothetical protein